MEELRKASLTDPLSGLLNRRGLEEEAKKIMARMAGADIPAALVICDLDHFKAVNDRFGHACGDNVIAAFAACLRDLTRDGAAARLGGEEFAVLLAAADLNTGRLFAEAARTACAGIVANGLPSGHPVTASFGVAEMQAGEALAALLRRADIALLDAKRGGRDCVRAYAAPARRSAPPGERRRNRTGRLMLP